MRITQIVPSVAEEASGPSYSVLRTCEELAELGHEVRLLVVGTHPEVHALVFPHEPSRVLPRRMAGSAALRRAISAELQRSDIVHSHGLWTLANLYPYLRRESVAARICSPRGTLMPWARRYHSVRKRTMWALGQHRVRWSDALHATTEAERQAIAAAGFGQRCFVIPNGVDVPDPPDKRDVPLSGSRSVILYLGRLHPIKGLDMLLESWAGISRRLPDWELRMVGRPEGDIAEQLTATIQSEGIPRASVRGPAYGAEKTQLLYQADILVLPTYSENFGVVVAEALAHGTPVITTTGTHWSGLRGHGCGWWVEPTSDAITAAILEATAVSKEERSAMGNRGRRWMIEEFDWGAIALRFEHEYLQTIGSRGAR